MATFNYTDDLVLNDGCLWDVRAAKLLHKFDKFNDYVSGVFHPSGLEIIINSEIVSFDSVFKYSFAFHFHQTQVFAVPLAFFKARDF